MEKEKILAIKKQELNELQEKINRGYKTSFLLTFIRPVILAGLGTFLANIFGLGNNQKVGIFLLVFFAFLFIFAIIDKDKMHKKEASDIEKRISLQKEIVKLIRELRDENN